MQNRKVTICACASRSFIDKDKVAGIAAAMENEGYSVTVEPDLCRKAMQASPETREIASDIIMACYPRAVHSLFRRLNLEANVVFDVRNFCYAEVLDQLQIPIPATQKVSGKEVFLNKIQAFPVEKGTDAWYPVIDKERCTECGKCHDFCLFGVYKVEDGRVKVAQPQNCKNNCPACARMCPGKAIIFPKYEKSPINGGITEEEKFAPEEMEAMYSERLRMRLQQRKAGISLLRKDNQ